MTPSISASLFGHFFFGDLYIFIIENKINTNIVTIVLLSKREIVTTMGYDNGGIYLASL
jgi:hypothetical protein